MLLVASAHPAQGDGVVGTGTPGSCTEAALDPALAGGGMVTFDCGPDPVTITLTAEKVITAETARTTVDGGGLVTLSGGNAVRVFSVGLGAMLDLWNLTIADGGGDSVGGGIWNRGALTVTNSTFFRNYTFAVGGGILNEYGTVTVTNSTFDANNSGFSGGGIGNLGTVTVTNSTFEFNSAADDEGGGIENVSGTLTVTNSTFGDNSAANAGGAIANDSGTVTVTNSTFINNGADSGGGISNRKGNDREATVTVANSTFFRNHTIAVGGGILNDTGGTVTVTSSTFSGNIAGTGGSIYSRGGGTLTLTNTILANSTSGGNCYGAITDGGHNIDDGTTCGFTGTDCTATTGTSFCSTDPQLDPAGLANNGGPTQTIALQPSSPAIDAGDSDVCANPPVNGFDQRGFVRPGIGHTQCSIGAYEADAIPSEACVGDCDGNGVVAIHELILGVNIGLDLQPVDACPAFAHSEGMVDIAQLITGVNNALGGCGSG